MITVKDILKKKKKKSKVITCVLSIIAALTNGVPELKKIEILGGSIDKIETLEVELKIVDNFRGGKL